MEQREDYALRRRLKNLEKDDSNICLRHEQPIIEEVSF